MKPTLALCLAWLTIPLAAQKCASTPSLGEISASPSWNGWGPDESNTRFQPAPAAQIPADQVTKLKVKWAFGFPVVKAVLGAPVIAAGRVFTGVDSGHLYSLDAATGCLYWSFQADGSVRSAVTVERITGRYMAFFGDLKANAYAVDAATVKCCGRSTSTIIPAL